ITTLVFIVFNEGVLVTLTHGTLLSGTITVISFLIYGPVCYLLARRFDFGKWKYVFFIPFINEIMYGFLGLYILNIRNYFPMEDDDYGVGIILLPLTLIMWIVFVVSTFIGIQLKKKAN
ncbi:hypothetical protein, partial [Neobacillus rhizosphaerae]|uniref:hypothetical protein n=1 Tax=Neobacillus rhizosphaerae TaxID=2880965 RepID=UPI00200E144E